jgi:hypothetical protein
VSYHKRPCPSVVVAALLASACGTRGDLSLGRVDAPSDRDASVSAPNEQTSEAETPTRPDAATNEGTSSEQTTLSEVSSSAPSNVGETSNPDGSDTCVALPLPSQRYDFAGAGTEVIDAMGGPSGTLYGGVTLADGAVALDGDDDYVDLPNGLLSTKTSATILLWTTAVDGPAYWRILDFGASSDGEDPDPDEAAVGTTYVALTTETGLDPNGLALFIGYGGASAEDRALTSLNLDDEPVVLGVVLDGDAERADLYVNGELLATTPLSSPLGEIEDVNNWLGRSQYAADPHYPGTYTELRVYDRALSECQVKALTDLGPDVTQ